MKYLIGLDIGTSSVKGVLMTADGKVVKKAHEGFDYVTGAGNVVEIPANRFLNSCLKAIKTLSEASDGEIAAICASAASGNLVVLDAFGNPSTPVINWQDKRVGDEARELLGDFDKDAFYRQIGWPFGFNAFPLAQLCYIKKHNPEIIEECGMVAMSTEYLYYVLTGKWGISSSAGTTFYLIDQEKGEYIPHLLEKLGIDERKLPPVMKCGEVLGGVKEDIAEVIGVKAGVPVVLGSFDHPSAARGVGVLDEGQMLLSCGTSWVGFFPVNSREKIAAAKTLIDPFLSDKGGAWATMASVASLSLRIKLYVNRYIDDSREAFHLFAKYAAESELGAGGLVINPKDDFDDEKILKFEKKHIARAIMEGTVKLLKEKLDALREKGISADSAIMVGGPSENPMWIQVIKEICGIPVKVIHGEVAGAVGACVLGGIGVGLYADERDAQEKIGNI